VSIGGGGFADSDVKVGLADVNWGYWVRMLSCHSLGAMKRSLPRCPPRPGRDIGAPSAVAKLS
jgi:hypothetical protein